MGLYSLDLTKELATLTEVGPISLAAAGGPDALGKSRYLPVLNAFIDPLTQLYRALFAEDISLSQTSEKSMEVGWQIVHRFLIEVRHHDPALEKQVQCTDRVCPYAI
jgi:hypothetical protein